VFSSLIYEPLIVAEFLIDVSMTDVRKTANKGRRYNAHALRD
jgi:hypothetical protein